MSMAGRFPIAPAHESVDPLLDRYGSLTSDKAVSQRLHGPISLPPVQIKVSHADNSCINSVLGFQVMRGLLC